MIKKLFLGIVLGLGAILALAPFDPWVKERAGTIFLTIFRNNFHCDVQGHVTSISIFPAALTLQDLTLTSHDKSWQWKAERYVTGFSWPALIFSQMIDMWVAIEGLLVRTDFNDGNCAIVPHLQDLMRGPVLSYPLTLKSVTIEDATTAVATTLENHFSWNGSIKRLDKGLRAQLHFVDGYIALPDGSGNRFFDQIAATIAVQAPAKGALTDALITVDGSIDLPQLGAYPTCFISGQVRDGRLRLQLEGIDQQLRVAPLQIFPKDDGYAVQATAAVPLSYIRNLCAPQAPACTGSCLMQLQGSLDPQGSVTIAFMGDNLSVPLIVSGATAKGQIIKTGNEITGFADLRSLGGEWKTTFSWDGSVHGQCHLENSSRITHPLIKWQIPKQACTSDIAYDATTNTISSTYTAQCHHMLKDQKTTFTGSWELTPERNLHWQSQCGDYQFDLDAQCGGTACLRKCQLTDGHKPVFTVGDQDEHAEYTGSIDLSFVRAAAHSLCNVDLQADGALTYTATLHGSEIVCSCLMQDATIRLAQTLNFIERARAQITIDSDKRSVTIADLVCGLHAGQVTINRATLLFDTAGNLDFAHLPIMLDHCLVTAKQDLFTMVSGALLMHKRPTTDFSLTGNIALERSQLKENIFSAEIQKQLLSSSDMVQHMPALPITVDLMVETKEPIRVDTHFLQANAHLSTHIYGPVTNPTIEGVCAISEGSIQFPYKSLFITKGEIHFLKDQPLNPVIELTAKNKIKNHHVALHVTGSLKEQVIMLDATPPLTEGQIVGLLVAGAHEESLQALLPTLLMQNVTNYIFSSHRSNFFERHIKPWMKRINVQLIPNFTQQSGRGGLRGALEVTINDRWRALIEKNFSLSEDTRFELEYFLSDDITFRLLRDERCDIGGEVEMKWKF